jgi:serine/threonine protein kinase
LANGFELNRDGIKRAPSHAVSSVQDSYADESDLASELAFIQAKAEHGAFLDGDFERVRQPPLPTQQHWSASAADFIMLRVLGRGASGTVQLAFHVLLFLVSIVASNQFDLHPFFQIPTVEIVALKVVNIYEDSKRHQMVKELQALVEVGQMSSSFVNFHGAYFEEGAVVLCIEYMNRGSLQV